MVRRPLLLLLALAFLTTSSSQASTWLLDTAHTSIGFKIKHLMITNVNGSFQKFDGKVEYDREDLSKSQVAATIEVASINTDNEQRDEHLRSADFFDVEKYPQMTFRSKEVARTEDGLKIAGDLTLHGVTREVILKVSDMSEPVKGPMGNLRMGAMATAKIDRRDFGLTWSKTLETGGLVVDNIVKIILEVELVRQ